MAAEIELKLFFSEADYAALEQGLNSLPQAQRLPDLELTNRYFDTPDLQLRHWDMGLRVRGNGAHREQTIKTAGKVAGGIHSRPEYNIDIQADVPDLTLFPSEIWPVGSDITALDQSLQCLFSTDFCRQCWHVQTAYGRVEVALDRGVITSNGKSEPICELEFELLDGQITALLALAQQAAGWVPVRLGRASKAQRGYQLAGLSSAKPVVAADTQLPSGSLTESVLIETLSRGVELWQQLDAAVEYAALHSSVEHHQAWWPQLTQLISALIALLVNAPADKTRDNSAAAMLVWQPLLQQLLLTSQQAGDTDTLAKQLQALRQHKQYGQLQLALVQRILS